MTGYQRLLGALEGTGVRVNHSKTSQDVKCPAHEDKTASLSVSQGENGALVHCHAGCPTEQVLSAVGLRLKDLFDIQTDTSRQPVIEYSYLDEDGLELFQQVRFEPKDFRLRHYNGSEWVRSIEGIRRVLYKLPEVIDAVELGHLVVIVEGEKDADRLHDEGFVATTSPMGAGNWKQAETEVLHGADVVVIPDNDEPGRAHAEAITRDLYGKAASLKVVRLPGVPGHGDVTDWLNTGHSSDELNTLILETPAWEPDVSESEPVAAGLWKPVDLAAVAAAGLDPIEPDVLFRRDGRALLYSGKLNVIFGAPEAGKTWIALMAVADLVREAVRTDGSVVAVFVDYEDDARSYLLRLEAVGISPAEAAAHTRYYSMAEAIRTAPGDLEGLDQAKLVVVDTVNSAMTLGGLDPLSNKEALGFINDVRGLRNGNSAAWLLLDHEPNTADASRRQAIGAQAKLGAVDGAQYRALAVKQPRPGHEGVIALNLTKDRAGGVRGHAAEPDNNSIQNAATVYMSPVPGDEAGRFGYSIVEPQGAARDSRVRAALLKVAAGAFQSKDAMEKGVRAMGIKASNESIREEIDSLASEGLLIVSTKGGHDVFMTSPDVAPDQGEPQ
jgi:hypothetical protein